MVPRKLDDSILVSEMPIWMDAIVRIPEGESTMKLVLPSHFLDDDAREKLLRFADELGPEWPVAIARKRTPLLLGAGAFDGEEIPGDHEFVARKVHRSIAVPQFQSQMLARPVGMASTSGKVLARWWRRRLAKHRKLDLGKALRQARRGHQRLRRQFGSMSGREGGWSPEFEWARRARAEGRKPDDLPAREWRRLSRSALKLVAFDTSYAEIPAVQYAVRFAHRTDMGGDFLVRYGRAIAGKGKDSRKDSVNALRWALCLRVWEFYQLKLAVDWTWKRMRRFQRDVIWNYELLKRGHPPERGGPESVWKWMRENGW